MTRRVAVLMLLASLFMPVTSAGERPSKWRTVWRVSQVLLAGAESADIASSWGKNEGNPLVRTGSRFSYGSLAIKLGVLTGGITAQHFIVRKSPDQARLYAAGNLVATAVLSVVAVHNMHVPAPH